MSTRLAARSFRQALELTTSRVHVLDLRKSNDLRCVNLMCGQVGGPCVCRLARFLEQNRWECLSSLILADNELLHIPSLTLPALTHLDVSCNKLTSLTPELLAGLPSLQVLDCSGNALDAARLERAMSESPSFQHVKLKT